MDVAGRAELFEFMANGLTEYSDVVTALAAEGLPCFFTQTGGRCGALQVTLERGIVLLTDVDEPLPARRQDQTGWLAGFYATDDVSEGPLCYAETTELDAAIVPALVLECLRNLSSSAHL